MHLAYFSIAKALNERTSFTCSPGAAVAFRALPNTPLLSVGGAPLREKKYFVHSLHHVSSWPHY